MYQCSSSIFISTFNIIIPDILILLDLTYSHLHLDQRFSYKLTKSSLLSTFPPPCHVCVMWFCWLHLLVTSSWGNLWSVKQLQWKLALQTLRPLFSAWKCWTAHCQSGTNFNPAGRVWISQDLVHEETVEREIIWRIDAVSAMMWTLLEIVVCLDCCPVTQTHISGRK